MAWAPDYITAAELRTYMRIGDVDDDTELALAVTAASRAVDNHCNRQFGATAGAEQRFYTARYDYGRGRWVIDVDDFMTPAAAGLVVTVTDVGTITLYDKEPINAAAKGKPWTRLVVRTTSTVMPTGAEFEVGVTANPWGWTATPSAVKLASKLQGSRFHSRRDSPYGIAGSPQEGSELRLLSKLDADVAVSLRGLVRPRAVL